MENSMNSLKTKLGERKVIGISGSGEINLVVFEKEGFAAH
jgi:hypothetical protein